MKKAVALFAVVLAVGTRFRGHASSVTPQSSATSAAQSPSRPRYSACPPTPLYISS